MYKEYYILSVIERQSYEYLLFLEHLIQASTEQVTRNISLL